MIMYIDGFVYECENSLLNSSMSSADSYFQKRSLVSKYLLFYLKSALYMNFELLFYVVIGSGALLARFGKKNSVSNQQLK